MGKARVDRSQSERGGGGKRERGKQGRRRRRMRGERRDGKEPFFNDFFQSCPPFPGSRSWRNTAGSSDQFKFPCRSLGSIQRLKPNNGMPIPCKSVSQSTLRNTMGSSSKLLNGSQGTPNEWTERENRIMEGRHQPNPNDRILVINKKSVDHSKTPKCGGARERAGK